jgi:predicted MFS family arabinose efflux permease
MTQSEPSGKSIFTRYQIFIIAILSLLQFTVILDFMVLSPLGVILLKELNIQTSQFGLVVSAYAFSAGGAGLLAAGFADKFDRKKLLLFFCVGFIMGTILCAVASDYQFLLGARIVTGLFGGVIGSISFAIITDLFKTETRGRVMGFVQLAFAASQILGIPIGLYLANHLGWHSPFWMIAGLASIIWIIILIYVKPIAGHLAIQSDRNAFQHLWKTLSHLNYLKAFLATTLLATGGFMLMPFGSAFSINNLKLSIDDLPALYAVSGLSSIVFGPLIGIWSDKIGKYKIFIIGSLLSITIVAVYTNLSVTPLWMVMGLNVLLFLGITSRMISSSALITSIPQAQDRGAFMSINSSIQQISGGIAATVAGLIVAQSDNGVLQHYDTLGQVVIVSMVITAGLMYLLNEQIKSHKSGS